MKKILLFLVALVATLSMNAQTTEIYKGTTKEATYSGADVTVSFGENSIRVKQGTTVDLTYFGSDYKVVSKELPPSTGTAKRNGNFDVNWVQLWKDGPKFAEYNVGATNRKATDYGYYFAWGGSSNMAANYNTGSAVLSGSDDTAYKMWGEHWRMLTKDELQALIDSCTVELTTVGGVSGRKFTGKGDYASNSIFLPAAGYYSSRDSKVYNQGSYVSYWTSTPNGSDKAASLDCPSNITQVNTNRTRDYGCSVRPVYVEDLVAVTSVSLNKTELKIGKGNTETLSATVAPADATNKKVLWTSNNESVATVDAYGKVKGVALGQCTITATTEDGEKTATCTVKVVAPTTGTAKATIGGKDVDVKWIQLWKDGPKFAEYNVGVTDGKKSSIGGYYEWTGSDIVTSNWGNNWRMPTGDELEALTDTINNCKPGWTNYGASYMCLTFTGKGEDYKNNEIAFPTTAYYAGSNIQNQGHLYYWSSTFEGSTVDVLWGCHDFIDWGIGETYSMDTMGKGSGSDKAKLCVRAVLNEPK